MTATVRIEVLGPPRGKGRPRFTARNGFATAYPDKQTATYEAVLRHEAALAMTGRQPLEGPLRLDVIAWLPIPASWWAKKRERAAAGLIWPTSRSAADLDNIIKGIDALNEVVWRDDSQIVYIHARKYYSTRPSLVLIVEPVVDLMGLPTAREAVQEATAL